MTIRCKFTTEFKAQVVLEMLIGQKPLPRIAESIGSRIQYYPSGNKSTHLWSSKGRYAMTVTIKLYISSMAFTWWSVSIHPCCTWHLLNLRLPTGKLSPNMESPYGWPKLCPTLWVHYNCNIAVAIMPIDGKLVHQFIIIMVNFKWAVCVDFYYFV